MPPIRPKGPAGLTAADLARGQRQVLESRQKIAAKLGVTDLVDKSGKPLPARRARGERQAIRDALAQLASRTEGGGTITEQDLEILGNQLGHTASRALRETFDALQGLKREGWLADVRKTEQITPEILSRLEHGTLPKALARHAQRVARTEAFQLFDHPIRDELFRFALEKDLKGRFHVRSSELLKLEKPADLTLRERGGRQMRALRALLTDSTLPSTFTRLVANRLGQVGDHSAIPALEALAERAAAAKDPSLAKAAKAAITQIQKAAKMTIVLTSMEAKPYCGTGGLSNVMAELPKALAKMGHKVIVLVPRHEVIDRKQLENTGKTGLIFGPDGSEGFGLFRDKKDGVEYYFIENDRYFSKDRGGIYGDSSGDYGDNPERYDFFGASIPAAIKLILGNKAPDVVQLNDAHTASAAAYLKRDGAFEKSKTIMAVHNLGGAYQGKFDASHLEHLRFNGLGVYYPTGPAEFYGQLNFMKLGLMESDAAITVSREYMREVLDEKMGEGLHGVMRVLEAKDRLWGNLNGIDNEAWSSRTDPLISHHFSIDDLSGKAACKETLQQQFGLEVSPDVPLVGVVARLTSQKGFDEILETIETAMASGKAVQYLVVGQGDPAIAAQLEALVEKYPGKVAFDGGFTTAKEHQIYAGSDFFLMPSKFEPCGLPQMYALRYATIPIVRAVGGLEESIEDFDPKTGEGNGFKFGESETLAACVDRALEWYGGGAEARQGLLENAVASDFSWETTSAVEQVAFYRKVLNRDLPLEY